MYRIKSYPNRSEIKQKLKPEKWILGSNRVARLSEHLRTPEPTIRTIEYLMLTYMITSSKGTCTQPLRYSCRKHKLGISETCYTLTLQGDFCSTGGPSFMTHLLLGSVVRKGIIQLCFLRMDRVHPCMTCHPCSHFPEIQSQFRLPLVPGSAPIPQGCTILESSSLVYGTTGVPPVWPAPHGSPQVTGSSATPPARSTSTVSPLVSGAGEIPSVWWAHEGALVPATEQAPMPVNPMLNYQSPGSPSAVVLRNRESKLGHSSSVSTT